MIQNNTILFNTRRSISLIHDNFKDQKYNLREYTLFESKGGNWKTCCAAQTTASDQTN